MAVPTINESPTYEIIASGVAYAKNLTATNSPTSWAISGVPSGISIDSGGAISGTPSVTTATSYTFAVTATNGDGTSAAKTWLVVVLPAAVGVAANGFTRPIDLDINTGSLQIPGAGSPLPSGRSTSPATFPQAGVSFDDDTQYLTTWRVGERFKLSVGASAFGVLQDVGADTVTVVLRETEDATGITISEGDFTNTGADATARFETTCFLDPDELDPVVSAFEGEAATVAPMLLGVRLEAADDDRTFTDSTNISLGTFTESSNVANTTAVTITANITSATEYDVTLSAVFPSDTSLNCSLTRRVPLTWGGAAYSAGTITGNATATGNASNASNWDVTLTSTAITATATGMNIGTTVVADAQKQPGYEIVLPLVEFTINAGALVSAGSGIESYYLRNVAAGIIYEWTLVDGEAAGDVAGDIQTGTGEAGAAVYFDDATDTVTLRFEAATAVVDAQNVQTTDVTPRGPNTLSAAGAPSYADGYLLIEVDGVEMPEKSERIASCAVPILVERSVSRTS